MQVFARAFEVVRLSCCSYGLLVVEMTSLTIANVIVDADGQRRTLKAEESVPPSLLTHKIVPKDDATFMRDLEKTLDMQREMVRKHIMQLHDRFKKSLLFKGRYRIIMDAHYLCVRCGRERRLKFLKLDDIISDSVKCPVCDEVPCSVASDTPTEQEETEKTLSDQD